METANLTEGGTQTATYVELVCSPSLEGEQHHYSASLSAGHIFLSVTAFLGNALIIVALHKECSLHPPSKLLYRCLVTTDLCVGVVFHPLAAAFFMALVHEHWNICPYLYGAGLATGTALCSVSLLTLSTISVDRLLALLLGLRYRQVVTLKRTYVIVATFWIISCVAALCYILDPLISRFYFLTVIPSCLVISFASYSKIFRALSHHNNQVQDYVQQQPSQPNALNMARYKKAVYSALWVQLALVVCYLPYIVNAVLFLGYGKRNLSRVISFQITGLSVCLNSTLNPFVYCWKISEVRRAVKQTIREALCCPWS